MWKYVLTVFFGAIGGIAGGMGMGGGTLLVPLLTFLSISQHNIQAVNLISFLPMSVIALLIHKKNKLLMPRSTLWIIIPAVITAVLGAILAKKTDEKTLKTIFGVFLLLFGLWQGASVIFGKELRAKNEPEESVD